MTWSTFKLIGSLLTRTGGDQLAPPFVDRESRMSPKQSRNPVALHPGEEKGSNWLRLRPSCQVTYTLPRVSLDERSTAKPWKSKKSRNLPCTRTPVPTGVTELSKTAAPKLAPPLADFVTLICLVAPPPC